MAQRALHDVDMSLHDYVCDAGIDSRCARARSCTPHDLNMSVSHVGYNWGVGSDKQQNFERYECAGGIDITSPNATIALTKLAAHKDRAKASLTTTLFWSMKDQSYDDVYAVYTGILGSLFGAFALLVTTLLMYALAAVKRTFFFKQRVKPLSYESKFWDTL